MTSSIFWKRKLETTHDSYLLYQFSFVMTEREREREGLPFTVNSFLPPYMVLLVILLLFSLPLLPSSSLLLSSSRIVIITFIYNIIPPSHFLILQIPATLTDITTILTPLSTWSLLPSTLSILHRHENLFPLPTLTQSPLSSILFIYLFVFKKRFLLRWSLLLFLMAS